MPQNYTPEFKKKIVRLHLEEGRTKKKRGSYHATELHTRV